jgi:hypothetical protein
MKGNITGYKLEELGSILGKWVFVLHIRDVPSSILSPKIS